MQEVTLEMQAERNARLESVNRALRKSLSDPASKVYGFPRVVEGADEEGDDDDNLGMAGIGALPGREGSFEVLTAGTGDTGELDEAHGIIVEGAHVDAAGAPSASEAYTAGFPANSHRRGFFSHDMS